MRTQSRLIRLYPVRAEYLAVVFRDVNEFLRREPIGDHFRLGRCRIENVCIAAGDDGFDYLPDGIAIGFSSGADFGHSLFTFSAPKVRSNLARASGPGWNEAI